MAYFHPYWFVCNEWLQIRVRVMFTRTLGDFFFSGAGLKMFFFPRSELCPFKSNLCSTIYWLSGSIAARQLVKEMIC